MAWVPGTRPGMTLEVIKLSAYTPSHDMPAAVGARPR